jgi:hypothetical protein
MLEQLTVCRNNDQKYLQSKKNLAKVLSVWVSKILLMLKSVYLKENILKEK